MSGLSKDEQARRKNELEIRRALFETKMTLLPDGGLPPVPASLRGSSCKAAVISGEKTDYSDFEAAESCLEEGDLYQAMAYVQLFVKKHPKDKDGYKLRATIFNRLGLGLDAMEDFDFAEKIEVQKIEDKR